MSGQRTCCLELNRKSTAPQQVLDKCFHYLSCCWLLHPKSQISFNQKQYSMNAVRIHVLKENRVQNHHLSSQNAKENVSYQLCTKDFILKRCWGSLEGSHQERGGHSAEHQGYILKVVCFRPTSNAIFKEAMKEVRSWLH